EERLARVLHVRRIAEGGTELAAPAAEVFFVEHHQGGGEALREVPHVDVRQTQYPVVAAPRVPGPYPRREHVRIDRRDRVPAIGRGVVGVPWSGRVRDHIRSGAVTPSMPSP